MPRAVSALPNHWSDARWHGKEVPGYRHVFHLYGRMRRVHLRGHNNIIERLLIHARSLNLGLLMRTLYKVGTPRALQDAGFHAVFAFLLTLPGYLNTDRKQIEGVG